LSKRRNCANPEYLHVILKLHPWRPLKTITSERLVPLVGASLWAAERIKNTQPGPFVFPRYTTITRTNANHASAALNKWLKNHVSEECVIHSFRHSLRDRLRAVQCPSDIENQIGGWSKLVSATLMAMDMG
jgi:integrase